MNNRTDDGELKETQEGVEIMCREMDQIYSEGEKRGMEKAKKETAQTLAARGMAPADIAGIVKVDDQLVRKWLTEEG